MAGSDNLRRRAGSDGPVLPRHAEVAVLSCYRILDLTDDRGDFAGFLLAQLGAEVIAVEPPGGQTRRHHGPWAEGVAGLDRSLGHWAYNRGKASVVLRDAAQLATLTTLAAGADVLLECGAIPLDLDALRRANPSLITVTLSPFGGAGPKAGWAATDLTLDAASGRLALTGDSDRPPVRISAPQVWANAGAEAAAAITVALFERGRSGLGQHLDVSAQEAMILTAQSWTAPALVGRPSVQRVAGGALLLGCRFRFVYQATDGHVTLGVLPGSMTGPFVNRLLAVMVESGECPADLAAENWVDMAARYSVKDMAPIVARTLDVIEAFVARRSTGELFATSLERHLLVMPLATPADVLASPQLKVREFWDHLTGAELGLADPACTVRFPGPFAATTDAPLHRLGPPPRLGQDDERLLGSDPGLARQPHLGGPPGLGQAQRGNDWTGNGNTRVDEPSGSSEPGGSSASGGSERDSGGIRGQGGALHGIRVVDLTWVYAGPFATRWLAYEGAEVIRVESTHRVDQVRGAGLPRDGQGGPEDSTGWHNVNAEKLSFQLNLSVPEARQCLMDLVARADVLIESFAPGVLDRLGLGPEVLRAGNDGLIHVSTSLFGHSGPLSKVPGFGNMGAAAGGFYALTGWPDRLPAGPYLAYTDATSPRLTVALIVAALDWRRRSGHGTRIDFSQIEGGVHFLTPAVLAAEINGDNLSRLGNADPQYVPHGIYPAMGEDRWVALACRDDTDWHVLCQWLGLEDLTGLDLRGRRFLQQQLDVIISERTAEMDPETFQQQGQARGLAVHQVQNSPECVTDPQLVFRQHYVKVDHPVYEHSWAEQFGVRASRTGRLPRRAGPCWGQHNEYVLNQVLGYNDDRIADLVIAGGLE